MSSLYQGFDPKLRGPLGKLIAKTGPRPSLVDGFNPSPQVVVNIKNIGNHMKAPPSSRNFSNNSEVI